MGTAHARLGSRIPRALATVSLLAVLPLLAACGSSGADITGVWQPDDGTGVKTVDADGTCTGMYYNRGRVLDIGGSMTCMLGDVEKDGQYVLVVRQPPNERTYRVRFDGPDTAVLMDSSDRTVVTLTRQ